MADDELPRSAGLYLERRFLPADLCACLREAAVRSARDRATVFRGDEILVDERVRRTQGVALPGPLRRVVGNCFDSVMPKLGRHFRHMLTAHQPVQLLAYERGAFFRPHQDNTGGSDLPSEVTARLVSAVVFLGRQTRLPEPGSYCGGSLTFFRLPGTDQVRTEIRGEEGMLVAFPATGTFHEVRPVTHGLRCSLVTWFTGRSRAADG